MNQLMSLLQALQGLQAYGQGYKQPNYRWQPPQGAATAPNMPQMPAMQPMQPMQQMSLLQGLASPSPAAMQGLANVAAMEREAYRERGPSIPSLGGSETPSQPVPAQGQGTLDIELDEPYRGYEKPQGAIESDTDLQALARQKARQYGVPEDLFLAQISQESSWNPRATSPKGAMGLAQFMPPTFASYSSGDPYDPETSLDAGARHMRDLLVKYNGNEELALAAYNAGEPAVDKHGGIPPYRETQDYIAKIQANRGKWSTQTGGGAGELPGMSYDEYAQTQADPSSLFASLAKPEEASRAEELMTGKGAGLLAALSMIPGAGPLFAMPLMAGNAMRKQREEAPLRELRRQAEAAQLYRQIQGPQPEPRKIEYKDFNIPGGKTQRMAVDARTGEILGPVGDPTNRWQPGKPGTKEVKVGDEIITYNVNPDGTLGEEIARAPRSASQGMTVYGPDGQPIVQMGGQGMSAPARNENQKALMNAEEQLARLDRIYEGFNPQWTGMSGWQTANWNKLKDWFGEDPNDDFTRMIGWYSDVTNNVNRTINELSGAAVTEGEARRISAELPQVSTDWTTWGDGPEAFKAKLDSARQRLQSALFRRRLADAYGFDWRSVSLDDLKLHPAVDRYYEQLRDRYVAEGMSADEAKRQAIQDVKRQIGM